MNDATVVLPEIVIVLAAAGLSAIGVFGRAGYERQAIWGVSALMAAMAVWVALDRSGTALAFNGAFVDDAFARFAKVLILAAAALTLVIGAGYMNRHRMSVLSLPILVLLAVAGQMVMVSAGDLLVIILAIEAQALAIAVFAGFDRRDANATEAGTKTFVLGAFATAIAFYGLSLVYGFAGATRLSAISEGFVDGEHSVGLIIGLVLMIAGIGAKIGVAPFHLWRADVAEGSSAPATAFFTTAPVIAALIVLARLMFDGIPDAVDLWRPVLAFLGLASIALGLIGAMEQANFKRFLAYAATVQTGFALVCLAAGGVAGAQAMLLYLVVFTITNAGLFALALMIERDGHPSELIADLRGLSYSHPAQAVWLSVLLGSLAGLPPMLGFFAKYAVIVALVEAGLAWLALLVVAAWIIVVYASLRIIVMLYLTEPEDPITLTAQPLHGAVLTVAAALLALCWLPFIGDFGVPEIALAAAEGLVE